jgi:hypothetical protein
MSGGRRHAYPNVRARLRRIRRAPFAPTSETRMVIWLRGERFRVRDESGRGYAEITGDVTAERGFGLTPRTMEGFMDAWDASRHSSDQASELYGDVETGEAVVHEAGRESWTTDAGVIRPVAEQLLADGREATLEPVGESTYLDRPCQEYRFALEGEEDGFRYRSDVRWLVSGPFVLLREVRDSPHGGLYALTEVLELEEGAVADVDLRPDPSGDR